MIEKENYILLVQKKLSGEISSEESRLLEKIRSSSKEHEEIYNSVYSLWDEVKVPSPVNNYEVESNWNEISARLGFEGRKRIVNKWGQYYKYAAAASLVLMVSLLSYFVFSKSNVTTLSAGNTMKVVKLPDNSIVHLNKNSQISFGWEDVDEERIVELLGEAYFSVTKNSTPFIVHTPVAEAKVLGTKFNIISNSDQTTLTVTEGRVSFTNVSFREKPKILTVNQKSVCYSDNIPSEPTEVNSDSVIAWTGLNLVFNSESVDQIFEKLASTYNFDYKIMIEDFQEMKLSASFHGKDLNTIIESITKALDLEFKFDGGLLVIFKD